LHSCNLIVLWSFQRQFEMAIGNMIMNVLCDQTINWKNDFLMIELSGLLNVIFNEQKTGKRLYKLISDE
jgi:hypothetical protein